MLITIAYEGEPATDLGHLLHKHPGRVHEFALPVGTAHVFLLDLSRSPRHLDITDDDASWSGDKQ